MDRDYGKHFRNFKINVLRETGKEEPSLSGLRMAGMKFCVTYEEGRGNWRAFCIRCGGAGSFEDMTAEEVGFTPIQDRHGRGEVCFLCQGQGKVVLPSPEAYGRLLDKWAAGKNRKAIMDIYESELNYFMQLCEKVDPSNLAWQTEVMDRWDRVFMARVGV